MKSNKGITLIALIIYIITLIIMVGIMANFVAYFNKNVNYIVINDNSEEQYNRFLSFISNDANSNELLMVKSGYDKQNDKDYIIFSYNNIQHQYIFTNRNIYYIEKDNINTTKKVLLCKNVFMNSDKFFNYDEGVLRLNFSIDNDNYSSTLKINV